MQPATITVSVDPANDGNPVNESWGRYDEGVNRSLYTGPDHSLVQRNTVALTRTMPKQSGTFRGMAKSSLKLTTDITVPTTVAGEEVTAPVIVSVQFAMPVGVSAAEAKLARQRIVAFLDSDVFAAALCESLEI